jgi:hypothetical protein
LQAWVGHPHIKIIDNSTDFAHKITRVEHAICQVVGAPRPVQEDRKFIVRSDISPEVADRAKYVNPLHFDWYSFFQSET